MVLETHFINKNYAKIPHYIVYDTKHPLGKSHGGYAILIRNNIKYHLYMTISKLQRHQ